MSAKSRNKVWFVGSAIVLVFLLCFFGAGLLASASKTGDGPKPTHSALAGAMSFGDAVAYSNGVSVSVSDPVEHLPSSTAAGVTTGEMPVMFKITITNTGDKPFSPITVRPKVISGGVDSGPVFDVASDVGFPPQEDVQPGASVTWQQAWSVADPSDLTVEVEVGFFNDTAIFSNK